MVVVVVTSNNSLSTKRRHLNYSEADFEFCRGDNVARMEVKFGMEEGTNGPLLHDKFHPHRCNDKCIAPPELKFLLIFDQSVEYKSPAGAFPLRDFHKICRVCTPFQDALAVKISLDLLKGLWSYGGFKLMGVWLYPNFQCPLAAKLCVRHQEFF